MSNGNTQLSLADRFTGKIISCYADVAKGIAITEKERTLIAGYYIKIDESLRNSKQGYTWKQVRMDELALVLAHLAKLGLDQSLGHFSMIPFKVKDTGTIRLTPVISDKGYEYIARRYALVPPKGLKTELVYETDVFSVIKKDANHSCDSYIHEVKNPFNRGKVIGAYSCLEYDDSTQNKLLVMSLEDLLKYKPYNADENFWKVGSENYKKMLTKTIAKQSLRKLTLDPDKVNFVRDSFKYVESEELTGASLSAQETVREQNGNGPMIDFVDVDVEVIEPVEKSVEPAEDENDVVEPEDDILGTGEGQMTL